MFSPDVSDYTSVIVDLVFSSGSPIGATACTNITIINDNAVELDEFFTINLSATLPVIDVAPSNATVTIIDDDSKSDMTVTL